MVYKGNNNSLKNIQIGHYVKSVRIRRYFGPYFSTFGLNTYRYSKCWKNKDQKSSEYGHFLHGDIFVYCSLDKYSFTCP